MQERRARNVKGGGGGGGQVVVVQGLVKDTFEIVVKDVLGSPKMEQPVEGLRSTGWRRSYSLDAVLVKKVRREKDGARGWRE